MSTVITKPYQLIRKVLSPLTLLVIILVIILDSTILSILNKINALENYTIQLISLLNLSLNRVTNLPMELGRIGMLYQTELLDLYETSLKKLQGSIGTILGMLLVMGFKSFGCLVQSGIKLIDQLINPTKIDTSIKEDILNSELVKSMSELVGSTFPKLNREDIVGWFNELSYKQPGSDLTKDLISLDIVKNLFPPFNQFLYSLRVYIILTSVLLLVLYFGFCTLITYNSVWLKPLRKRTNLNWIGFKKIEWIYSYLNYPPTNKLLIFLLISIFTISVQYGILYLIKAKLFDLLIQLKQTSIETISSLAQTASASNFKGILKTNLGILDSNFNTTLSTLKVNTLTNFKTSVTDIKSNTTMLVDKVVSKNQLPLIHQLSTNGLDCLILSKLDIIISILTYLDIHLNLPQTFLGGLFTKYLDSFSIDQLMASTINHLDTVILNQTFIIEQLDKYINSIIQPQLLTLKLLIGFYLSLVVVAIVGSFTHKRYINPPTYQTRPNQMELKAPEITYLSRKA